MGKIGAIMMMVMVVTFVTMEAVVGQDPNNNAPVDWQHELQKHTGMSAEQLKQKAEEFQRNTGITAENYKQKAEEYFNKLKDNNNNNQG